MSHPPSVDVPRPTSMHIQPGCEYCGYALEADELRAVAEGKEWHVACFKCAQCMCSLVERLYYREAGRFYCQHDYATLYAPLCAHCGELVVERSEVVRSVGRAFHARCFRCDQCSRALDSGVWIHATQKLCQTCNQLVDKSALLICETCAHPVNADELLRVAGRVHHAYHFHCNNCSATLSPAGRENGKGLWCEKCYNMECEPCAHCHAPIDPQKERSVVALGVHWHVSHFGCSQCARPFNGHEHYEHRGRAYCLPHYQQVTGRMCFRCGRLPTRSVCLFGKEWCETCYTCRGCDRRLSHKDRVLELDALPLCKACFKNKSFHKVEKERSGRL